jgi:lipopolysaccharide transport system permease protein
MSSVLVLKNRRFIHLRDLLGQLIARDIKLRYKRSVIGVAWTLLNPLSELLVLLFIFRVVLRFEIPNYTSFLFIGILVYGWFQSSLFFAAEAIVANRDLIKQPGFPPAILPIATVASNLLHFLLALPVLFAFLWLSGVRPSITFLGLPVLIAAQFILTLSLAYVVAAFHVRFRDTQYVLRVLLQLLFYLSGIFYAVQDVPPRFQTLFHLNPLVYLIEAYRSVLMRNVFPEHFGLLSLTVLSILLLISGIGLFKKASYRFVEELG